MNSVNGPTTRGTRWLVWSPRILAMAFIAFVSMFALDVFDEAQGPDETLIALFVHLIPSWILIAGLVLAWRRPWFGTIVYAVLGVAYVVFTLQRDLPSVTMATRLLWCATIAGPALLVAALFWISWRRDGHPV